MKARLRKKLPPSPWMRSRFFRRMLREAERAGRFADRRQRRGAPLWTRWTTYLDWARYRLRCTRSCGQAPACVCYGGPW